jgi:hypothetical protein
MTDTLQKTPKEISVEKGEQIIIALITYFLLVEILTFLIKILNGQAITVVSIIRFILTIVACVYLYKGQNWAKLLLTLGTSLGVFTGAYFVFIALKNPAFSSFYLFILLAMTILNAVAAYFLIYSTNVDEFLKSRKA